MFTSNPFYHKVFKRAIIAFGSMFSNIHIERRNSDGSAVQKLKVPIAQAPKEKWIVRVDSDPNLENHTYTVLPRIAFEITGVNYDPSRKLNKIGKVVCASGGTTMTFAYAPVPYNVDITLYVLTKTQEDAFQIVEQILPYFTPEFTLGVKSLDQLNVVTDIPIVLTSVSQQGIITKALIDIGNTPNSNIDPDQLELYTATNIGNTIDERITNRFAGDYRPPVGQPDVAAIDSTEVTDLLQIAKNGTVILEQTRE